ncbi:MAG: DUF937 domain-containing protein [Pseudomonadota bacterium]
MSLLQMLQQAQGGQGLGALARQFGIDESQMDGLTKMLAPTIAQGTKRRAQAPGGIESMLGQMMGENQGRFLDDPEAAAGPDGRDEGERFLEQVLGSREASAELGHAAAERSGISPDIVSQLMPALAAMMQGGMQRQMPDDSIQGLMQGLSGGTSSGGGGSGGGIMDMVGGLLGGGSGGQSGGFDLGAINRMLDADGDGSALDDILEKVMR